MDAVPARLWITTGPDEGKAFGLKEDIVHIGRGGDNQIVLSDPALPERLASIASRNGRYAIYVPTGDDVQVDGSVVPPERWTWLPPAATIRLGVRTVSRFESTPLPGANAPGGNGRPESVTSSTVTVPTVSRAEVETVKSAAASPGTATAEEGSSEVPGASRSDRATRKKKPAAKKGQVARFITDQPGETLVKLGEDGTLPELALREAGALAQPERAAQPRSPVLLYGALGCSFVLSLGLLLFEPAGTSVSTGERDQARGALTAYFGDQGDEQEPRELEPYQKALRQALIEHSRGDYAAERRQYRLVLQMLNAADIRDPANLNGLTGRQTGRGRTSDQELREHLETLIAP
jgi:hypothetical protein